MINSYRYAVAAPGAQRDRKTGKRLVPAVMARGERVQFDGAMDDLLVDRKLAIVATPKVCAQAYRQSLALQRNNLRGMWQVPDMRQFLRATALLARLKIRNIGVGIAPV